MLFGHATFSNAPISINDLFAAFEEKNLDTLQSLASSIKNFDAKETLRKTETKDSSKPNLRPLQHSLSIQKFDLCALRHVGSLDKSDPLHIYNLSIGDNSSTIKLQPEDANLPDIISLSSDEHADSSTKSDDGWVIPDVIGHSISTEAHRGEKDKLKTEVGDELCSISPEVDRGENSATKHKQRDSDEFFDVDLS